MEVWIETYLTVDKMVNELVTSHVEVWIETVIRNLRKTVYGVTSHVEVWIETSTLRVFCFLPLSPPTWRCGLKRACFVVLTVIICHLPRGGVD